MRIWVTRTAPGNQVTATRLKELGHEVVDVPVLDVCGIETEPLRTLPDAIVFTSGNGVRHHPLSAELLDVPVFTVGDATGEIAARAGYRDVRSAQGDIVDLQRLILKELPRPSRLVHFGGRDVAGQLTRFMRNFGYLVDRRIVYAAEAVAVRCLLEVRSDLASIDGIVVHSPRAAERVARVLTGTWWKGKVWCISQACALKLTGVRGISLHFTARPSDAALIEMVRQDGLLRTATRASIRLLPAGIDCPPQVDEQHPANDNDVLRSDCFSEDGDYDGDPPPAA